MSTEKLNKIFDENFDCYAGCDNTVIAMTKEKFIEVVSKLLNEAEIEKQLVKDHKNIIICGTGSDFEKILISEALKEKIIKDEIKNDTLQTTSQDSVSCTLTKFSKLSELSELSILSEYKDGKQLRRERRAKERKNKHI